MILLKEYETLSDVLIKLKHQVIDSLNYADDNVPDFSEPASLFYWLKDRTIYKNDPSTIELLMTMETMLSGTRTGIPGAGDCDDFTISGLASCLVCGFGPLEVVLAGRDKRAPVHIYFRVLDGQSWKVFDLTNSKFNQERDSYKFKQYIPFKI